MVSSNNGLKVFLCASASLRLCVKIDGTEMAEGTGSGNLYSLFDLGAGVFGVFNGHESVRKGAAGNPFLL
jgi:hypothetical protein